MAEPQTPSSNMVCDNQHWRYNSTLLDLDSYRFPNTEFVNQMLSKSLTCNTTQLDTGALTANRVPFTTNQVPPPPMTNQTPFPEFFTGNAISTDDIDSLSLHSDDCLTSDDDDLYGDDGTNVESWLPSGRNISSVCHVCRVDFVDVQALIDHYVESDCGQGLMTQPVPLRNPCKPQTNFNPVNFAAEKPVSKVSRIKILSVSKNPKIGVPKHNITAEHTPIPRLPPGGVNELNRLCIQYLLREGYSQAEIDDQIVDAAIAEYEQRKKIFAVMKNTTASTNINLGHGYCKKTVNQGDCAGKKVLKVVVDRLPDRGKPSRTARVPMKRGIVKRKLLDYKNNQMVIGPRRNNMGPLQYVPGAQMSSFANTLPHCTGARSTKTTPKKRVQKSGVPQKCPLEKRGFSSAKKKTANDLNTSTNRIRASLSETELACYNISDDGLCTDSFVSSRQSSDASTSATITHRDPPLKADQRKSTRQFVCDICPGTYTRFQQLRDHYYEIHHVRVCPTCKMKIADRDAFEAHLRTHYVCKICGRVLLTKNGFMHHKTIHERPRLYECDICCKKFVAIRELTDHLETHVKTQQRYFCSLCECKGFSTRELLEKHTAWKHGVESGQEVQKTSELQAPARRVMDSREEGKSRSRTKTPVHCRLCGHDTSGRSHTRMHHVIIHSVDSSREPKYECNICHWKINNIKTMNKHLSSHV